MKIIVYLIDTSVWIDYFRNKNTSPVKKFLSILEQGSPFAINGIIYQEILQGAETETDFLLLKKYLATLRFVHPKDPILSYESAATIFYSCRRQGVTIRSTIDCLIAQFAIEHDLVLLHHDKDYVRIKSVIPTLKLWEH